MERISSFVEVHLKETAKAKAEGGVVGPGYVFEHCLRVAFWCWRLALEMHADVSTCVTAGLLHAVSHFEPEPKNTETAKAFMEKERFKREFVDAVAHAIENHARQGKSDTLESKILEDADKLDRFGYLRLMLFIKSLPELPTQMEEAIHVLMEEVERQDKGEFGETWTSMAKARLYIQLIVYRNILSGILEEIENTRTTMSQK